MGQFHGVKSKREKELRKIQENQGVILTSYGKHHFALSYLFTNQATETFMTIAKCFEPLNNIFTLIKRKRVL